MEKPALRSERTRPPLRSRRAIQRARMSLRRTHTRSGARLARRTRCARASARVAIPFFRRGNDRVDTSGQAVEEQLSDLLGQPILDAVASNDGGQCLLVEQD